MDFDIAPPKINSYLKQIQEITTHSEETHCQITEGEKTKLALEKELERLECKNRELENFKNKNVLKLSDLKTKLIDLKETSKGVTVLKNDYQELRKIEDAKIWELSTRFYSEITVYCDKVQAFVNNYRFTEMINKLVYPGCDDSNVKQAKEDEANMEADILRCNKNKLKNEIQELYSKHALMTEALERKASIKQERFEGKEFLDLQVSINKCKEESKKLFQDISEMEHKIQVKRSFQRPGILLHNYNKENNNIKVNNVWSNQKSCNIVKESMNNLELQNIGISTCSDIKMKKEKKSVQFVPKTVKRFKTI